MRVACGRGRVFPWSNVDHVFGKDEVGGSSPLSSSIVATRRIQQRVTR